VEAESDPCLIDGKSDSEGVHYRQGVNQSDQHVTIGDLPEGSHAIRSSEQSEPGSLIYATCQFAEPTRKSYSIRSSEQSDPGSPIYSTCQNAESNRMSSLSRTSVQSNPYSSPFEELHSMSRQSGNQSNFERTSINEESDIEHVYSVVDKSKKSSKTTLPQN
jgi:hypothetical protein